MKRRDDYSFPNKWSNCSKKPRRATERIIDSIIGSSNKRKIFNLIQVLTWFDLQIDNYIAPEKLK